MSPMIHLVVEDQQSGLPCSETAHGHVIYAGQRHTDQYKTDHLNEQGKGWLYFSSFLSGVTREFLNWLYTVE